MRDGNNSTLINSSLTSSTSESSVSSKIIKPPHQITYILDRSNLSIDKLFQGESQTVAPSVSVHQLLITGSHSFNPIDTTPLVDSSMTLPPDTRTTASSEGTYSLSFSSLPLSLSGSVPRPSLPVHSHPHPLYSHLYYSLNSPLFSTPLISILH